VFGDEGTDKMDEIAPMLANTVRGNLVVNMGGLLVARNNAAGHKDDSLYDTSLDENTVIEGNTFVAGPMTQDAVLIVPNAQGRPHGPARFRRNVVIGPADAPAAFRYENNAWKPIPDRHMVSESDLVAELVNPGGAGTLTSEYPAVGHNLRLDDYRPRPGSVLGAAGIGALAESGEEPPVEPPPPDKVDWAALAALADEVGVELVRVVGGLAKAGESLETLRDLIEKHRAEDEL
jgi:hypothetical protein